VGTPGAEEKEPAREQAILGGLGGMFGQFPVHLLPGGGNSLFAEMVQAQQGVDVEALMESLLQTEALRSPPTSKAFLASLQPLPLSREDLIQLVVRVDGMSREVFPTAAAFGINLARAHPTGGASDTVHVHLTTQLVLANPVHGESALTNAATMKDNIALVNRGKVTFVEKAKKAQEAGAKAVVVCQTDKMWPYVMTDKTNQAAAVGLSVPVLCVSLADAQELLSLSDKAAPRVRVFTRATEVACPVCQEELEEKTPVLKLPCLHLYHPQCLTPWLEKRNTCPMCRYELPTETKSEEQRNQTSHNVAELSHAMFS
jgi:hypothetical protein